MINLANKGSFLRIFLEPRTFGDEAKAVIRFVEILKKENFINFVESKGYDYKVDFDKRIVYGPQPLTEKEMIVFVYHVVFLLMRRATLDIAKWVVSEILRMYEAPDSSKFRYAKIHIANKMK